ncbi:hypothetical protein KC960_05140 [Candidatus Saccharibacteria bacterium]|nr:hypothetical protein [Candidatus Saccharibacteria bacterium]
MNYHISKTWAVVLVVLALWELIWKITASWHAARRGSKSWFVILIVVNSAGILPILYLLQTGSLKMQHDSPSSDKTL